MRSRGGIELTRLLRVPGLVSTLGSHRVLPIAACILVVCCGDDEPTVRGAPAGDSTRDATAEMVGPVDAAEDSGESSVQPDSDAEDAGTDSTISPEASTPDADTDAQPDVYEERGTDAVSQFCGDRLRDPVLEECDDGPGDEDDSCTSDCRVRGIGLVPASSGEGGALPNRSLGTGRHVSSAGDADFAVVYVETGATPGMRMQTFDGWGRRSGGPINFGVGSQPTGAANPVIAALPGRQFAVGWTEATSGTPDIALRLVQPGTTPSGVPRHAHDTKAGPQQDPDVLWTGNELVVAWSELFRARYRRFDQFLNPLDIERALSADSEFAGNVALAPVAGGWAAAWRAGTQGLESIHVRVADVVWKTASVLPATEGDHPALVELDSTHLLLFFTATDLDVDAGRSEVPRLRTAVVDVTRSGADPIVSSSFVSRTPPNDDARLRQSRPAATRVGDRIFVAWQTESPLSDPLQSELWLAEVGWSPSEPARVQLLNEWPAVADFPRAGDQINPALASAPQLSGGALITAWEDHGRALPGRPAADVLMSFRPVPFVTLNAL